MQNLIKTKEAQCKDCYRCLRNCPVKAISFSAQIQARVDENRCILCGRCVVECPQQAKVVWSELGKVKDFLARGEKVVLSLAPSFPASFSLDLQQIRKHLSSLGFMAVEETARGAVYTTREYQRIMDAEPEKVWLSSCCPVVVNLVESYYPHLIPHLLPVLSPMAAHSRELKSRYGDEVRVVFAGPCVAKLQEAEKYGLDAALTFSQLKELFPPLPLQPETAFVPEETEIWNTRMYPVHQGVLFSLQGKWELQGNHWAVEGIEQCRELLEAISRQEIAPGFVEMMSCVGGCVGGPVIDSSFSLYKRRQRVAQFFRQGVPQAEPLPAPLFSMQKGFEVATLPAEQFSEADIKAILAKMGKNTPEDERNCEGCGYKSCRDKALAVLAGRAVPEMCIPYMRARAESYANTIVQSTPNAILVLDDKMRILDFNPAASRLFQAIPIRKGLVLKTYLDTENFERCLLTQTELREIKVDYPQWGLYTRQIITPLGENLVMGIFTDLTQDLADKEQVRKMKEEITAKAKEVLNRQMTVAQTIAGLLGETTAETKATLLEILKHLDGEGH